VNIYDQGNKFCQAHCKLLFNKLVFINDRIVCISFHSSRKRTKEIGIRKINGATVFGVISLLNKDFLRWVIIAFVPASLISFYIMNKWLQGYAYRTELNLWIFALAGMLTVTITLLTVSGQSWRAAIGNPVKALRNEQCLLS